MSTKRDRRSSSCGLSSAGGVIIGMVLGSGIWAILIYVAIIIFEF